MGVNLKGIKPVKVSTDLSSYSTLIYGEPKIGKTTFVHDLYGDRVLMLMTEKRYKTLGGAHVQYIGNWTEFTTALVQLRDPAVKEMYDVVAIDTIDNLFGFYESYVASKYNEKMIGENSNIYGKDWTEMRKGWKDNLLKIERAGYVPVFVSHAVQQTVQIPKSAVVESEASELTSYQEVQGKKDNKTYLEFQKFVPSLRDKDMAPINKMVDNILFLSTTSDEQGNEHRVIYTRGNLQWLAGSTFKDIKPMMPLDANEYRNAMNEAIARIDKSSLTDERQADIDVQPDVLDYNALMSELKTLGVAINKAGHKDRVVSLSDEIFGLGVKMTDAQPRQVELVAAAVEQLKALAKELGVEYGKK